MNQAYSRLSTTHGHIHRLQVGFGGVCRYMRGDLMWTCLVWAERSTPDNFWVPPIPFRHRCRLQVGFGGVCRSTAVGISSLMDNHD